MCEQQIFKISLKSGKFHSLEYFKDTFHKTTLSKRWKLEICCPYNHLVLVRWNLFSDQNYYIFFNSKELILGRKKAPFFRCSSFRLRSSCINYLRSTTSTICITFLNAFCFIKFKKAVLAFSCPLLIPNTSGNAL